MTHTSNSSPSSNSSPTPNTGSDTASTANRLSHTHDSSHHGPTVMSATETSNGSKSTDSGSRPGSSSSRKKSSGAHSDSRPGSASKTLSAAAARVEQTLRSLSAEANGVGDGSSVGANSDGGSVTASESQNASGSAALSNTANTAASSRTATVPYPAPSVGLPVPTTIATSLLNLEVKVLTQALGAENQWVEQGDGRVSFCDFTIRVTAPKPSKEGSLKERKASGTAAGSSTGVTDSESLASSAASQDGVKNGSPAAAAAVAGDKSQSVLSNTVSDMDDDEDDEVVILEDTISNDTPFVGENCCIVWNSFEKQLSLCLMYASEEGYSASWSALVALQDKSYPPFRYDLLERCRPAGDNSTLAAGDSESSATPMGDSTNKAGEEVVLPYAYFIHERHNPPLGFIEQHALSCSIMEHHHASNPALYADKETVIAMLSIANADLLDHLVSDQIFPLLLTGLQCNGESAEWVVPAPLRALCVPPEITSWIAKDRRITFLQESVLPTCCKDEMKTELMTKYSTLSRRIRNDIVCGLLTCDDLFDQASEALRVLPPVISGTPGGAGTAATGSMTTRSRIGSIDSSANTSITSLSSGASPVTAPLANDTLVQAQKAEQQVLAHLHFFLELVTLSIAELGREMVGPIVSKVYQCGLLYSLSLVAERFAMPANVAAIFVKRLTDGSPNNNNNGGLGANRRAGNATVGSAGGANGSGASGTSVTTPNGANFYSPAVEQELAALLDATLVRINERQEEQLMNGYVRTPILSDPLKYNGLVTFMVRQLIVNGAGASSSGAARSNVSGGLLPIPKRTMRDSMSTSNPFVLFHVLGLHDDEGSAASERVLDPENTLVRNQFHSFIVTKYLAHATRGTMQPVPLPPSLGGVAARNAPIVRFDNAAAAQNGTTRAPHHDGAEGSTSTTVLGVPNTGVGVGAGANGANGGSGAHGCGCGGNGGTAGGNSNANGSPSPSPVLPLPQGVTPALIRVLEYLVALTNRANRELVLKTVFHPKSHILHFIEGACDTLCNTDGMGGRCQVGLDVLCGCVRFLKVVITQMALPTSEQDENPLPSYAASPEPLSSAQMTTICRQLTVERDTFGYLLRAYNKLGGVRRNTVFHSSLLSVLDIIGKCPAKEPEDKSTNNLRDVRDYLFYKHLVRLPEVFARRFREELLDEVSQRLGREASHSPNDSVSVLSSTTGSDLLRSSSKLRFVDEVEAVAGGVDGTVVPGSVMDPAIMASMVSAEERQRKRNARSTLDQWTATVTHVMSSPSPVRAVAPLALSEENGGRPSAPVAPTSPPPPSVGARVSPPMTINITRPSSTSTGSPRSLLVEAGVSNRATGGASPLPLSGDEVSAAALSHLVNGAPSAATSVEDGAALSSDPPIVHAGSPVNVNGGSTPVLKPTAPKNEKPPGRPRNFASVLEASAKNAENGCSKSRSVPNMTTGMLSPPSSPEEQRLSKSGTMAPPIPLARSNSTGEGAEPNPGPPSSPIDNVILPRIKKRVSASGRRI